MTDHVVLYPHSDSNRSDDYLVVGFSDWIDYVDGKAPVLATASRHDTYPEAEASRDQLNGQAPVPQCQAAAYKGTGHGICGRPLDEHGQCDRFSNHLPGQ